jgi:LPXTG-motif cell wall-anchored protein
VVSAWRRQFAAYYYMLTQYRGRVVNTVDGVDDNAYYEFGSPDDDKTLFTADSGVEVAMNGWQPLSADGWETINPPGPDMKTVLSFTNVPGNAGVTFAAGKVRIIGDQAGPKAPANAVSVRMRIPVSAAGALKGASASVTIGNLAPVRLPPAPAALVADGAWHTYVAALSSDDYKAGTFDGFSFSPSDKPYTGIPIEVEFIRIAQVPSLKDADKIGVRCGACSGNPLSADAKKKCSAACTGKDDTTLVQVDLSDGWVDSEDNCPGVYNPDQADGNGDGVGDACEDFDADGIPNAWDNCPTTTNSRQVDKNGNGVGDVCDGSQTTPCFLKPDSLGGPMSSGPGALLGVLLAGSVGVLVFRRRRRK